MTLRPLSAAVGILVIGLGMTAASGAAREPAASQFSALTWRAGTQPLAASHGTYVVPADARMVTGADAQKADELLNGRSSSDAEAVVALKGRGTLYLSYNDDGHVTLDDWKDVDAAAILKSAIENTDAGNADRIKAGVEPIHVVGWIAEPTLDRSRNTVTWILGLRGEQHGPFVNAIALVLGRHGFERFTLATSVQQPASLRSELVALSNDYQFDQGFRFSDYVTGDKLAGYGVAALVGGAVGATVAKTIGFGAVILLIKKFFFIIVAACAGAFSWARKRFARAPAAPIANAAEPVSGPPA